MTGASGPLDHRAIGLELLKPDLGVEGQVGRTKPPHAAAEIADDEDREAVLTDLASIPGLAGAGAVAAHDACHPR